MSIACIDLFCGAGGLAHGLNAAGIPVIAGIDLDENCRYPFEKNNNGIFLKKDVGSTLLVWGPSFGLLARRHQMTKYMVSGQSGGCLPPSRDLP